MKNTFSLDQRELAEKRLEERRDKERRRCKECGKDRVLREFGGRIIKHLTCLQVSFLNSCKECYNRNNTKAVGKARKHNQDYARVCKYWARSRKMGVKSDLKLKDVKMILQCPCYYCEATDGMMTLDRKDSKDGYVKNNTVPCCLRCNMLKSDMPWEAWQRLIPAVRNVAKLGLFGDWNKQIKTRAT